MQPGTLCPAMDNLLTIYGLETLKDLISSVEVARLVPEMRHAAAAVVEHLPFAAHQLAAVLSRPGQAATEAKNAASQLSHCLKVWPVRSHSA